MCRLHAHHPQTTTEGSESEEEEGEGSIMGGRHRGAATAMVARGYDPVRVGRRLEDITQETLQLERTLQGELSVTAWWLVLPLSAIG